ncbi:2-oxo acid dehydrogenase subunit E2 [Myxococcota bacterium]|nr:2-oxo acid dehydrogenase subunit E2 [Myxococcota bacterium]MBU1432163.1 2-oxo acid dehydrogenase subunit E2 [Myxococcota bacterium]MBU1899703.1 2-oxo acid dehydrogenase subunit E2 [Myxococcota bacterium]
MPHLDLHPPKPVSNFRRIAIGTWARSDDPSVYGTITARMDAAEAYMRRYHEVTGARLTINHLMAKAMGAALTRVPQANAVLRFNRLYQRRRIGVFFQVAMLDEGEDKIDLSGLTLYDVERLSLAEIITAFEAKVEAVRRRQDPALERARARFQQIPAPLLNVALKLIRFFTLTLNLDLRRLGLPNDPFGSVMITNIGSLGLEIAYAPLVPYSGVPLLLALSAVERVPVVDEGGAIVARAVMRINATFDHRVIDGAHAAIMAREVKRHLEDPEGCFGPIEARSGALDEQP